MKNDINFEGITNGEIIINGKTYNTPKTRRKQSISMINDKLYVNGKKFNFETKQWSITLGSIYHYIK